MRLDVMVMGILLAILLGIMFYLLLAPFALIIDSNKGLIQIRMFGIIRAQPIIMGNDVVLLLQVFGLRFRINLTEMIVKQSNSNSKGQTRNEKIRVSQTKDTQRISFRKIRNLLSSFRYKVFHLHIDTGNYPLNGLIFPAFFWLGQWTGKDFQINFESRNILVLHVENSIGRMLLAYLKPSTM